MGHLRKDTETLRETLSQEFRYLVPPEHGAGEHDVRRVTIVFPPSPTIALAILPYAVRVGNDIQVATSLRDFSVDPTLQQVNSPNGFGLNRHYKAPIWNSAFPLRVKIRSNQSIVAASTDGHAFLSIAIEYLTHQ